MSKVSVIIPNYNHEQFLNNRLETVLNQTYQDFEIILLDDCSTDNSREILESFKMHPKVTHVYYNESNSGTSYYQWYKGIELASGELVWIAESDDLCDSHFLEVLVPCFNNDKTVLAFTGSQQIFDDTNLKPPENNLGEELFEGTKFICNELLAKNSIYNASMALFRKQRYNEVKDKGFRDMKLCGDWLLWIQMLNGFNLAKINGKYNYFRQHGSNTTKMYRKVGLDFIEGMKVLKTGKKICGKINNRKAIYSVWRERYLIIKNEFTCTINFLVLYTILRKEPLLFLFMGYKRIRKLLRLFFFPIREIGNA